MMKNISCVCFPPSNYSQRSLPQSWRKRWGRLWRRCTLWARNHHAGRDVWFCEQLTFRLHASCLLMHFTIHSDTKGPGPRFIHKLVWAKRSSTVHPKNKTYNNNQHMFKYIPKHTHYVNNIFKLGFYIIRLHTFNINSHMLTLLEYNFI